MKKVWILEKWIDRKACEEMLEDFKNMFSNPQFKDEEACSKTVKRFTDYLSDPNFEGYWCGHEGKSKYSDFCSVAADFIYRHKNDNYKLRVVSAQIEDDAKYWTGYKNPVENEGVLRYLYVKARSY